MQLIENLNISNLNLKDIDVHFAKEEAEILISGSSMSPRKPSTLPPQKNPCVFWSELGCMPTSRPVLAKRIGFT